MIEESWTALTKGSRSYQQFLIFLLFLGVSLPILVVSTGVQRITKPIDQLTIATKEVAKGNFGQSIDADTGDEVEVLAEQFNLMSAQLQESYTHLEQRVADRTKELAALNDIAMTLSQSLNLDEILNDALDKTIEVMHIEAGGIYLLNEEDNVLCIAAQKGFSSQLIDDINELKVGEGFSGRVIETGEPIIVHDASTDARLTRIAVREEGLRSLAAVPLSASGKTLGTLFTITHGIRKFSNQDIQLLTSIGNQIGVAVENALLYEEAQRAAVMEERSRLARDLHDSVTQSLYSLTLLSEAGQRMIKAGNFEVLESNQTRLGDIAQQALQEMRLMVYELRPYALRTTGLVGALEQRLEAVERRAGVEAHLTVKGELDIEPQLEEELFRIGQEALNNALKHSGASEIQIKITAEDQFVELMIVDNGCGFDPKAVREKSGLGLINMHERAEKVDGDLEIRSVEGEGTRVRVKVKR